MYDQLLNFAKDHLKNIIDSTPELQSMDKQKATQVTGESIISSIMNQVKDGQFGGIKELLSGNTTGHDHDEVKKLEKPVSENLMNKLGVSKDTAILLAVAAIPLVLNMMNSKVNTAKQNGVNVDSYLNKAEQGGGLLSSILKMFGANNLNPSGKIMDQLIKKLL